MTRIYLIRHAEAEGNLYRVAHGHYDSLITDRGYEQIKALEKRFADIHIDAVYSSDLFRTRTTAKAIYVPKGLPLHTDADLREVNLGVWEDRPWQELTMESPEQMYFFNRRLEQWQIDGCETAAQVLDRFLAALHRISRENDGKTVAVFSHGAAMRIVLGTLQGLRPDQLGDTPHSDNTAVSLLEADGDTIRVIYRDDNQHLVDAGLSTFARQSWWKDKRAVESGIYYAPSTEALRQELTAQGAAVPTEGHLIIVMHDGHAVGFVQLLPEKDPAAGWIGCYWLSPAHRGRRWGIAPLGQAVKYYRARGIDRLRMDCPDGDVRRFFEKFGFYPLTGDTLEKYIGYEER